MNKSIAAALHILITILNIILALLCYLAWMYPDTGYKWIQPFAIISQGIHIWIFRNYLVIGLKHAKCLRLHRLALILPLLIWGCWGVYYDNFVEKLPDWQNTPTVLAVCCLAWLILSKDKKVSPA